jgi:hypothetical protein
VAIRMGMRRMTRLTNAFSKKWENRKAAYALGSAFYNLCRVHKTLRVTPAMAAGITDHTGEIGELIMEALRAGSAGGSPWLADDQELATQMLGHYPLVAWCLSRAREAVKILHSFRLP